MKTAEHDRIVAVGTADVQHTHCASWYRHAPRHLKSREASQGAHRPLVHPPFIIRQFLVYLCWLPGAEKVLKALIPGPIQEVEQHVIVKRLRATLEHPFTGHRRECIVRSFTTHIARTRQRKEEHFCCVLIKPTARCNLTSGTFSLCQYLKDAELGCHHNGSGQRHCYYGISKRSWHNSCPQRNPLQEVLRNSIKPHNFISR